MSLQKFSIFHEADAERLKAWHRPYAKIFTHSGPVLDVGCGPGYFSEVMASLGVTCLGIDLDPSMVEMSNNRGQTAELGDEQWIAQKPSFFGGVHISHVVEHLWGDALVVLLENACTALCPGGLIIIRTPNWENRYVRERLFWMDHTHMRPYPRELLVRMLKDLGMDEIQSGAEPFGMNDTFVVAAKPPNTGRIASVEFPLGAVPPFRTRWKIMLKKRLRRFLEID